MELILVGIYESQDPVTLLDFSNTQARLSTELSCTVNNPIQNGTKEDIVAITKQLLSADGVVLLRGWECSDKASEVVAIAHILRKPFYFLTTRGLYKTSVASEFSLTPLLPSDFQDHL